MPRKPISCLKTGVFLAVVLLAPLGTRADEQAAKFYEDALLRIEQGDTAAAVIQLRNAVQREPGFLPAQVLLGTTLLGDGDGGGAEKALAAAMQLGADRNLILPLLAEALLQQGKYEELLERVPGDGLTPAARTKILLLRGQVLLELGRAKAAQESFAEAARLSPASADALAGQATALLHLGLRAEAGALAEQATRTDPENAAAWNTLASVAHAGGEAERALQGYGRAIELGPGLVSARVARVGLLLDLGRDADTAADLDYLEREAPYEPRAAYLRALVKQRANDAAGALEALRLAAAILDQLPSQVIDRQPQLLLLGGVANYSLSQPEKARPFLERYITRFPEQAGARKLLASILLAAGQPDRTIEVLLPVQESNPGDYRLLSLLGTAYMAKGQHGKAVPLLEEAARLSGDAPDIRTNLGLSRLGLGDRATAVEDLAHAFAKDPARGRTGVALALLHLRRGEHQEALRVAREVVDREPRNLTALSLLASAQVGVGDRPAARASLERALAVDGGFQAARIGLARLDLLDGNAAGARERLQLVLRSEPKNLAAMQELARLEESRGNPEEAARWLEKARGTDMEALVPRLALVEFYLRRGQADKALGVAREAEQRAPENPEVLDAVARAYLATDRADLARVVLQRLSRVADTDAAWLWRAAQRQMQASDRDGAIWSLQKAVRAQPGFLNGRVALSELLLQAGRPSEATDLAEALRSEQAHSAVGHRLLGDIAAARGDDAEALARYRSAQELQPSADGVLRLYLALRRTGATPEARELLESRVAAHPRDTAVRRALAENLLEAGDWTGARAQYEVIVQQPDADAGSFNNLAYILDRLGAPEALTHARKARELAPQDPAVNDTLGWILVRQGQAEEGLRYLREAHYRATEDPEIRYHMAVALHRLGRISEARSELERALAGDRAFEGVQEARRLREQLRLP